MAVCGTNEDGVVGGDDVIALQNDVSPPPSTTDAKLRIAGDANRDGAVDATDVITIKRWIARKVCDGTDGCGQAMNNNCAGTWRFIFLTGGPAPGFVADEATLPAVCANTTLDIEGILVGDFDGSWPNFFPEGRFTHRARRSGSRAFWTTRSRWRSTRTWMPASRCGTSSTV